MRPIKRKTLREELFRFVFYANNPIIYCKPPYDMISIRIVANNTPRKIARDAFFISNSNREAMSAPVHAPVPGSGIPTKARRKANSRIFKQKSNSAYAT